LLRLTLFLVTASVVPSLLILVALMMEAIRPSEIPVLTRGTRRNISEDEILHRYSCENLKYYVIPSSPITVTLKMEALSSSETSVLTRATTRNIPEDTILHSYTLKTSNLTTLFPVHRFLSPL
jgi:hypothetical protein